MQTDQFWLKGACNVVTFAFANVQANFTTINTTLCKFLWSFLVECVYVIIIIFAIYNYHYYVYAHLQSGQCMFTKSSQRIFAQYVGAHVCSLISAFLFSLASPYSHSLVSAQPVLRIFTQSGQCTASASVYICSLVSAQPGQRISGSLISVVIVISVCNIRWPFFSKETFCSSECVEFWQAINIIILNANFMRKIGLIFPKVTVKENSLNCYFFLSLSYAHVLLVASVAK